MQAQYVGIPGATQLPLGKLMGLWFPKIRGRMIGFTMAGNNFSAVVTVPIATFIILASGWRFAFYGEPAQPTTVFPASTIVPSKYV